MLTPAELTKLSHRDLADLTRHLRRTIDRPHSQAPYVLAQKKRLLHSAYVEAKYRGTERLTIALDWRHDYEQCLWWLGQEWTMPNDIVTQYRPGALLHHVADRLNTSHAQIAY